MNTSGRIPQFLEAAHYVPHGLEVFVLVESRWQGRQCILGRLNRRVTQILSVRSHDECVGGYLEQRVYGTAVIL